MVGQWPLKPLIGVRIPVPKQINKRAKLGFLLGEATELLQSRQGFERLFLAVGGKVPAAVSANPSINKLTYWVSPSK